MIRLQNTIEVSKEMMEVPHMLEYIQKDLFLKIGKELGTNIPSTFINEYDRTRLHVELYILKEEEFKKLLNIVKRLDKISGIENEVTELKTLIIGE